MVRVARSPVRFAAKRHAAGRLDFDSEGLLLLTDDGALAARLTDPRHATAKTYLAQVEAHPNKRNSIPSRRGAQRWPDFAGTSARTRYAARMAVATGSAGALSQDGARCVDRAGHPRRPQSASPPHDRGGRIADVAADPHRDRRLPTRWLATGCVARRVFAINPVEAIARDYPAALTFAATFFAGLCVERLLAGARAARTGLTSIVRNSSSSPRRCLFRRINHNATPAPAAAATTAAVVTGLRLTALATLRLPLRRARPLRTCADCFHRGWNPARDAITDAIFQLRCGAAMSSVRWMRCA